jgi:hypothetical protein
VIKNENMLVKKYILYCPKYNEENGGVIAMYKLCDLLNTMRYEAYVWKYPLVDDFILNKNLNTPTIYTEDLENYIIVYMESVAGNPLNAPNVVRWFLNKPGFFTNKIIYGHSEYYFYFQEAFYKENYIKAKNDRLCITQFPLDIYQQTNFGERVGSCYLMRKGKGREIIHDLSDSICLDGLSHLEISKIFNRTRYFYSYDLYTTYSTFAVLCGCISVVMPKQNLPIDKWQPIESLRYGVAYGIEEIDYAIQTQHKVAITLELQEESNKIDLINFIEKTQNFFMINSKSINNINNEKLDFIKKLQNTNNKIIYFGTSETLNYLIGFLKHNNIEPDFLSDNNHLKWGEYIFKIEVISPYTIVTMKENFDVLITSIFVQEITEQLSKFSNIKNIYSIYG